MAFHTFHLYVTILVALSSFLISSNDLPTSEAVRLLHESQAISSTRNTPQMSKPEIEIVSSNGRMEFEINRDYPGSGANNRHTPNPPAKD